MVNKEHQRTEDPFLKLERMGKLLNTAVNSYLRFQGTTKRNYYSPVIICIYPLFYLCQPAK